MLKLGSQNISALYLGSQEIKRAYLGEHLVFGIAPSQTYTITAAIDPSGGGTVSGAGQYQEGAAVTLVATAGDGYEFSGWQEGGAAVSTDNPYSFTAAGDRTLTAAFEKTSSRLPTGYTEIEYIESDSNSYIQTDISLADFKTRRIVMDIQPGAFANSQERIVHANTANSKYFLLIRYTATQLMFRFGSRTGVFISKDISNERITVDWDFPSSSLTIGDYQTNFSGDTSVLTSKIQLLGNPSIQAKLYSAQIYISGALSGDYVPCINPSGSLGVYDLVSAKFYANAGTGTFTAGPAV